MQLVVGTVSYTHLLSLNVGLDMRFGGLVASYCNLYGTQAGWTERSLQYRDPEHGGMTWTSQYADSKGIQYTDCLLYTSYSMHIEVLHIPHRQLWDWY